MNRSYLDVDGISDLDDTKSVISRTGTTSDGIRNKILAKEYSTDDCLDILTAMGLGYTADQAAKKATSLTENVKSVELLDPRKMSTGSDKISDTQIGRNVFEAIRNMISQGGEPLVAVVKTNFSLESYLSDLQARMFELEENISQLEASYTEPIEPKEDRLKLRLEVDLENNEENLRSKCLREFQERTAAVRAEGSDDAPRRSRRLFTEDAWEDSNEFKMFESSNAAYVKVATRKYKEELLALYTSYDLQVEKKEQVIKELKLLRDLMRRQQVLEIFVSELKKQCNLVVQKLKTALMSYPFVREKLAQNIIVNGESIIQPLATENLSGIYALLHQEYNKITMGAFCDYLMALMSESSSREESNRSPQLQLKRMDKHLKTWLDMDLEKFMTPDHLFTICLLRSYHPDTVIRSDGVRHILEYSRRLESDKMLKSTVGEYANMPLYTELVRWINDVHVKSMQFSSNTSTHGGKISAHQSTTSSATHTDRKQYSMEQAAAVTTDNVSGSSKPTLKTPPNCTYASGPYDFEVPSSKNLYGKSGYRYQATVNKCYPCSHRPKCFQHKCNKCHYWGHNEDDCCQHVRKSSTDDAGRR